MDIKTALKEHDATINLGCRWLIHDAFDVWEVLERLPYIHKNRTLYKGDNFEFALEILCAIDEE